jgi:hypothetical protein
MYVGLNCNKINKTCILFANYSSPSTMMINLNSTFVFIKQPPSQNTSNGNKRSNSFSKDLVLFHKEKLSAQTTTELL